MINLYWQDFKKPSKIEAHTGMNEGLEGELSIQEALQMKIKATIEQNNKSYLLVTAKIFTNHFDS